jgi:branched-subunit amino acid ABC-type transport system permease component
MTEAQFALIGLGVGAIYVLIAQGIVLIYRGSGILNFGQGSIAVVSAELYYNNRENLGSPLAGAVALGAAAAIGLAMQLVMQRLRNASALVRLIATLGLFTLVLGFGRVHWGSTTTPIIHGALPTDPVSIGSGIVIGQDRFILFGLGVVLTVVLWLIYTRTRYGLATSAVAENERAAITLGWSPNVIGACNWVIGSLLAGVAGIALAPISGLSVTTLSLTVIPGLAAALVGNFSSFWLTLAGGLFLGVV